MPDCPTPRQNHFFWRVASGEPSACHLIAPHVNLTQLPARAPFSLPETHLWTNQIPTMSLWGILEALLSCTYCFDSNSLHISPPTHLGVPRVARARAGGRHRREDVRLVTGSEADLALGVAGRPSRAEEDVLPDHDESGAERLGVEDVSDGDRRQVAAVG